MARPGTTDGGAFEVSMTMDGRRQLRYDWLLLLHQPINGQVQVSTSMTEQSLFIGFHGVPKYKSSFETRVAQSRHLLKVEAKFRSF